MLLENKIMGQVYQYFIIQLNNIINKKLSSFLKNLVS